MNNFKLKKCPYCDCELIFDEDLSNNLTQHNNLTINTRSEEHIIPKSLGNDDFILPKGIICDKCNHYFSTNIEKPFMDLQAIHLLRSYHLIPSRKKKIPPLKVLFCGDEATMVYNSKLQAFFLEVAPETSAKFSSAKPEYFFSKTIDIDELKQNYIVSRMLIKIFTECDIYYTLEEINDGTIKIDDDFCFIYEDKPNELIQYVRRGKPNKIYTYEVKQIEHIEPFSNSNNLVSSIKMTLNSNNEVSGMVFRLFELEFTLTI